MNDYMWFTIKIGLASVVVMMTLLWTIAVIRRNAGWVDLGWVLGLILLAVLYSAFGQGYEMRRLIVAVLVSLWGVRLGGMLLSRLLTEDEDKRYQKIRASFGPGANWKFFLFFQFQGLLDIILAIGFFLMCFSTHGRIAPVEWLGITVWAVGFIGEASSDAQLKAFKDDPNNKGKVCESGFWQYSRHPNYFFEWLIWAGYFIMALDAPWGWVSVVSPILMLHFLLNVSGVPLAEEQSLRSRGDAFREYQRTTSVFVPLPRRPNTAKLS